MSFNYDIQHTDLSSHSDASSFSHSPTSGAMLIVKISLVFVLFISSIIASLLPPIVIAIGKYLNNKNENQNRYSKDNRNNNEEQEEQENSYSISIDTIEKQNQRRKRIIHRLHNFIEMGHAFAGGILLAGGLLHLLPDSEENINHFWSHRDKSAPEYPISFLLTMLSLLMVFSIEAGAQALFGQHDPMSSSSSSTLNNTKQKNNDAPLSQQPPYISNTKHDTHSNENNSNSTSNNNTIINPINGKEEEKEEEEFNEIVEKQSFSAKIGAICLWASLSVHSLFAGLGLGAETDLTGTLNLLFAILSHKFLAAFALGTTLTKSGLLGMNTKPWRQYTFPGLGCGRCWGCVCNTGMGLLVAFSLSTPLGIAGGIAITESLQVDNAVLALIRGILLSLAAGAFLHVALFEVLAHVNSDDSDHDYRDQQEYTPQNYYNTDGIARSGSINIEYNDPKGRFKQKRKRIFGQLFLFFIGTACMAILAVWV